MIFTDGRGSTCHCGQERSERQARPPSPFMAKVRHRPRHKGKLSSLSMFSLCLLVVTSLPSAVQSTIICAHADSTCTNCRTLCGDAQFYPILPSFCHPESRANYSYSEIRPDSTGPSLQFTGIPISTPNDLLPTSIGDSFSVSGYFKKNGANGTVMELVTNSNFTVSIVLLDDVLRVHLIGTDTLLTTPIDEEWTRVAITLEGSTESEQSAVNISLYINNTEKGTSMESINFPTSILHITAGLQYFGFLQDFGIYLPALNETELSQCLCYPNGIGNIDTSVCSDALESRYNVTPHVVDLLFDDSSDTYWQSEVDASIVNIQLHLSSITNLSKIFITFESALPLSVQLDYMYLDPDSIWIPLQYWADDCMERFSMENDGIPSNATEAVCTSHNNSLNMDTLEFLIAAGNRTIPTGQQNIFSTNQLRLVMNGFDDGASYYAIREFEVCTNFCTDTSSTCACTDSASLVQSPSFGFESMSTSVFLLTDPESTSAVVVAPTMTFAQSSSSSFESTSMLVSMSTDRAAITPQASLPTIHFVTSDIVNTTLDALVPSSTSASGFLSTVPSDFTVTHQTSVALSQSSMSFDSASMPTTVVVTSQTNIQPTSSYDATFQTSVSSSYVIAASSISMSETDSQMSTSLLSSGSYTVVSSSNVIQEEITSTLESISVTVTPSATVTSQQLSVDSIELVSTPTTTYMSSYFNPGISTVALPSSSVQVALESSSTVSSSASQSIQFTATTEDIVQTSTVLPIPSPVMTTSRVAVDPSSRGLEISSIIGLDMTSISSATAVISSVQESSIESNQIFSVPTISSVNPETTVILDSNGTNPSQSVLISATTEGLATFETSSMFPTPLPMTMSTLVVSPSSETFSSATGLDAFTSSVAVESSPVQLSLSSFEATLSSVAATPALANSVVAQTSPLAPAITSITGQASSTFVTDIATSSISSPVVVPSVSLVGVNPTQSSSFDIVLPTSTPLLVASSQIPTTLSPTVEPTNTIPLLTSIEESLGTTTSSFLITVASSIISSSSLVVPSSFLQEQSMSPVLPSTSRVITTNIEAIPSSLAPTVFQSSSIPFLTVIGPTSSVIEPSIGLEPSSTLLQESVMISSVVEPTSASSVTISDTVVPTILSSSLEIQSTPNLTSIVPSSSVQVFEVTPSFSIPLLSSFVTALPTTQIQSSTQIGISSTASSSLFIVVETSFSVSPSILPSTMSIETTSVPESQMLSLIPAISSTGVVLTDSLTTSTTDSLFITPTTTGVLSSVAPILTETIEITTIVPIPSVSISTFDVTPAVSTSFDSSGISISVPITTGVLTPSQPSIIVTTVIPSINTTNEVMFTETFIPSSTPILSTEFASVVPSITPSTPATFLTDTILLSETIFPSIATVSTPTLVESNTGMLIIMQPSSTFVDSSSLITTTGTIFQTVVPSSVTSSVSLPSIPTPLPSLTFVAGESSFILPFGTESPSEVLSMITPSQFLTTEMVSSSASELFTEIFSATISPSTLTFESSSVNLSAVSPTPQPNGSVSSILQPVSSFLFTSTVLDTGILVVPQSTSIIFESSSTDVLLTPSFSTTSEVVETLLITPTPTQQEFSTTFITSMLLFETPSVSVFMTSFSPSITTQSMVPLPTLQQESSSFVFPVSETETSSATPFTVSFSPSVTLIPEVSTETMSQITPTPTQQESPTIIFETPSLSMSLFPSITSQPILSTETIFLPITPTLIQQESSTIIFETPSLSVFTTFFPSISVSETEAPSATPFTVSFSPSFTLIPEVSTEVISQITPTLTQQESSTILFETPSLSVFTTLFPSIPVSETETPSATPFTVSFSPSVTLIPEVSTETIFLPITTTVTQQESSTILFETPSLSVFTTSLFPSITSQLTLSTETISLPITPTLIQQESSSIFFFISSSEILSVIPFTVSLSPSVSSLPTETPITSPLESSPFFSTSSIFTSFVVPPPSSLEILTPELSSSFEILTTSPFQITTPPPVSSITPTFTPTPTFSVSLSTFSGVTPSTGVFTETLLVSPSVSFTFGTGSSGFVSSVVETFIPETTSFLSTAVPPSFQPSPMLISSGLLQSSARSTPDVEPSSTLVLETTTAVTLTPSTPLQLTESTIVATSFEISPVLSSTPVESSIVFETNTGRLVITSTPAVLVITSTPAVLVITSTPAVLVITSTPAVLVITSTPAVFESSAIFIEPTSTLPTSTIEPMSSSPISSTLASQLSSLPSPGVTTSVTTSQFSMSPTPLLSPSPSPTPPPEPPFAPFVVEIDGLGLLRQAVPVNPTDSDGLHYEIDAGAYIGITEEDTMGSVKVSLGEFSINSMPYYQEIRPPFSIDVALANDEVWSDKPDIVFAVQVRDSLLSTNTKVPAVSAFVNHSAYGSTETHSCYLDEESGVCNMTISLRDYQSSWFTSSDEIVNLTVSLNTTSTTKQVTLRSVIEDTSVIENTIFMKLPSHSVFPKEIISIPIYATYEYLLTSFTLNCSIDDSACIKIFTGPETHAWSLITSFPNAASCHHYASVTGFRNYNADNVSKTGYSLDDLAMLYVEIDDITAKTNISVQCKAVNLLLTTMISPETNFFVNATDREGVRDGRGLLFAEPISAIKLFLHSEINQVINTAVLTKDTQSLRLTIQTFYSDGRLEPVTENLTCESDNYVIKVNSNCLNAFFDGAETEGGQSNITVQYNNASGSIPFRVWLPLDTIIEVDDDTLNKINNPCSENSTLYQKTKIHVVTNLSSTDMTPINSVYLTPVILPYLRSSNTSILTINDITGEVLAHGPGEAKITISNAKNVTVSVNNTDVVDVLYLDVFIFSDISVEVPTANVTPMTSTTIEISLLQEFSHITSTVNVVGVAVFSDGQRMVLDEDMVDITALWDDSLDKLKVNMFSIAEEVDRVGFDVSWKYSNECSIKNKENIVMFNSSIPQSIEIFTNSMKVALSSNDSAHMVGIPDSVDFEVLLHYENSDPVPLNNNIIISTDEEGSRLINIANNKIAAAGMMTGMASIIAEYNGSMVLNNVTNITVVKGENLSISAHPYPHYEGSRNNSVTNIQKIGSSFQMVEIVTELYLSDGSFYDITDYIGINLTSLPAAEFSGNVLNISDNFASHDIHINVTFFGLEGNLKLSVTQSQLQIDSLSIVSAITYMYMENHYQVYFDVIFEGDIHLNNVSSTDYRDLVELYTEPSTSSLSIDNVTGIVHVISNHYQMISLCVRSIYNSVYNCTDFSANLQPQPTQIDLGNPTGLPLEEVNVGDNFQVPVFLNLDSDLVSIFQIELTFNNELVRFSGVKQGSDWENGQIVYVDPTSDDDFISFGGILHGGVKGSQLNLAIVNFISNCTGVADFSANVTFIAPTNVSEDDAIVEDEVSDASHISLEITDVQQSTVIKRAVGPYAADEEPPLSSPLLTANQRQEITRLRRKRQDIIEPSLPGDANGDGHVDLRDVYLFQLYISESVFNFSSDFGQMVINTIDEESLDVDGDGIITLFDVEEVEIVTLNLAYEAVLNVAVDYNDTIDKCSIEISGTLRTISRNIPPDGINVHVVLGFSSPNKEFDNVFSNITFSPEVMKSPISDPPNQYGGIVKSEVSAPEVESPFALVGTINAIPVGFNVSVAVIVTNLENSILFFSNDVRGFNEAESLLTLDPLVIPPTHVENILSACIPPSVTLPSTTSITPLPSPSPSADTRQSTSTAPPQPSSAVISTTPPLSSSLGTLSSSASQVTSSNVSTSQPVTSSLTMTISSQVTSSTISTTPSPSQEISTNVSTSQPASVSSSVSVPTSSRVPSVNATTTMHSSTTGSPLASSTTLPSNVSSTTESLALTSSTDQLPTTPTTPPPSTESLSSSGSQETSTDKMPVSASTTPTTSPTRESVAGPSSSSPNGVGMDSKPTTSSLLRPTPTQVPTDATNPPATTSGSTAATVVVVLSIIIVLLLVAISACGAYVGYFMFRRKKGHYLIDQDNGTHFRNSIASDGAYFQDAENCIEMSPRHGLTNIDIVPLEHYGSMMETSIDVVANYNVVTSDEPYGSTSQKLLINPNSPDRGPPKRGGPAPMGAARQSMGYTESATAQTGATMAGYTSSSMERSTDYDEDDEDGQLVLPEFEASQAYLSLGLTPLSQLSPDAHTSTEYGFFPSMPPPVAPSNSIFSTSTSSLAIDSTFSLHSGGQSNGSLVDSSLMPDPNPERRTRRNKYDSTPLSQGFPLKLEPVMEQSPPVTGSQYSGKQDGLTSSEESSEGSPRDQERFMFPSAIATPEFSRLSQGRTAMRKRSGMKGGSKENLNVISPRGKNMPDYGSFGVSRHKPPLSPSQQAKLKRQKAREVEVAKQKEESRRRREQEERERQQQQEQRMARTARHLSRQGSDSCFPSATLTNGLNSHERRNSHEEFSTAETRFDRPYSRHASSTSIGSSSQSDEPSPRKWSRHSRHSSLDETPLGGAHRLQHSDSTHLYTTHEHM